MVSIVIPVIRPEGFKRCHDAIQKTTDGIFYEVIAEEDTERIGCTKMVKRLVEKSQGDMVCFLGDDTIPQYDWLSEALEAMSTLPDGWGLVSLTDQNGFGEDLALHWLADKRLLPLLGGEFFHTGYRHSFADNELTLRCKELGRYMWAENAVVEHDNPITRGETPYGTDHEWPFRLENYYHDRRLFKKRMENGWK